MCPADDDVFQQACRDASSWTISDGIDGRHVVGIRLRSYHATRLEIDPVLTFQFDPITMSLTGSMIDGTPIGYAENTELPFGEPGSPSDFECCSSDPLPYVARLLPCAIAEARHGVDVAAGRLRSVVFFHPNGEYELETNNHPSQLSPEMAVAAIDNFYTITAWGADMVPSFRLAGPDEEAEVLAYSARQGDYQGWTAERLEAAGGILLARLVEEDRAVRQDLY